MLNKDALTINVDSCRPELTRLRRLASCPQLRRELFEPGKAHVTNASWRLKHVPLIPIADELRVVPLAA